VTDAARRTAPGGRVVNFSAGPGVLPLPVLEQAQRDLVALPDVGASPLEVSHRGAWFTDVIDEAERNLRELLAVPTSHHVLFLQGGASMQFSMVASNLLRGSGRPADYVLTGSWGEKALKEARREGDVRTAWTDEEEGYRRTPTTEELLESIDASPAYVHVTTNETIQGVEFPDTPIVPDGVRLVADASSDFLSRPVAVDRYAVLYAGAQKNAGPAGLTIAVVRNDVLATIPDDLPTMLDYRTYVEHRSLYNTPPVFSIYVFLLVTRWLRDEVGGLDAMLERDRDKAALLYDVLDGMPAFYRGHAERASRSLMNVTFRLPTEELERAFVAEAADEGLVELKGHRSVGGIRASIYNAMPVQGVQQLAAFMRTFADRHA
jgi:phosphoserine aminotransferase